MPSPLARAADAAGDAVRKILAYHGSPHLFDKFDASKIGTRTRQQAYGYGHYFGDHASDAEYYRQLTTGALQETPEMYAERVWRTVANDPGVAGGSHGDVLEKTIEQLKAAMASPGNFEPNYQQQIKAAIRHLQGQSGAPPSPRRLGAVYEVEIGYPESALLNLEAPATGKHRDAIGQAISDAPRNKWADDALDEYANNADSNTILESVMRAHNSATKNPMANRAASQAKVSESLRRAGVPGSVYSADGSGLGNKHYVMFPGTEDSITILRKYGLLPAVGAGAAAASQMESQ